MHARTRRDMLRGALVMGTATTALAATSSLARASEPRRGPRGPVTFVFVTGANGSASNEPELVLRGHRALGVDLPGHESTAAQFDVAYQAPQDLEALATKPSPVAGVTLADFTARVVDTVRRAARNGPVILVGGSMGGATVSMVGNEVPHLIDRIVYDSAFCCVRLPSPNDYLQTPEGSGSEGAVLAEAMLADPRVIGALRTNYRTADRKFLAKAKRAMMPDGTDAEFHALLAGLQPDESLSVPSEDSRVRARTWGRIPRTYIRHSADRILPPALQDRMIAEADELTPDNRFDVRTVHTGHAPSAEKYGEIIDILDGLAELEDI